jgi:YHS domain-containing protein
VNSLSRIILAIFTAILVGGIVSLLRLALPALAPAWGRRRSSPRGPLPLFRDPSCGTFVSPEISVRAEWAGRVEHFCSEQCRDRYLQGEQ